MALVVDHSRRIVLGKYFVLVLTEFLTNRYLVKPYDSGWEEGMVSLEGGKSNLLCAGGVDI